MGKYFGAIPIDSLNIDVKPSYLASVEVANEDLK